MRPALVRVSKAEARAILRHEQRSLPIARIALRVAQSAHVEAFHAELAAATNVEEVRAAHDALWAGCR